MKKCLTSLLFFNLGLLSAQEQPIGTWKAYPSFQKIKLITGDSEVLFASSDFGLFSYREGQPVNRIGQQDGLSGNMIGTMLYLPSKGSLLVGYQTGEIDLISTLETQNDRSLTKLDSRLDKNLYDVTIAGAKAYFASDLGIVEYDLNDQSARDIFRNIGDNATPVSAYQILNSSSELYAFTTVGLLRGSVVKNLLDFTQWESLNEVEYNARTLAGIVKQTILFSVGDRSLHRVGLDGTSLTSWEFDDNIRSIENQGESILIATDNEIWEASANTRQLLFTSTDSILTAFNQNGRLWLGTRGHGLIDSNSNFTILPNGPITDRSIRFNSVGNHLYSISQDEYGSLFYDGNWKPIEHILDIAVFGTDTLVINSEGELTNWFGQNITIPLQGGIPSELHVIDDELWVSSRSSNTPLVVTKNLIDWDTYTSSQIGVNSIKNLSSSIGRVIYGQDYSNRIIAFDPVDRRTRVIDSNDGIAGEILDFEIDQEDVLYITSSEGLFFAPDATFIFDGNELTNPFISRGDLLVSDHFTAVEIDAGNRKWLATTDGLWLYDSSLSEQLSFFSRENSPLPSNEISELYFQETNGLLWVLSDGISSYQTDARKSQTFHNNVKIFPNPLSLSRDVRRVGVTGIAANAQIKITTLSGRYITEIEGFGSMSSWDLLDRYGRIVSPGIYLFFSSNSEGTETFVGKLLVEP